MEKMALNESVSVVNGRRWVDEGSIVTSAGISAGLDMSLHLVERFAGRELALKTARHKNLPQADIPNDGIEAYLSQSSDHQLVFMQYCTPPTDDSAGLVLKVRAKINSQILKCSGVRSARREN